VRKYSSKGSYFEKNPIFADRNEIILENDSIYPVMKQKYGQLLVLSFLFSTAIFAQDKIQWATVREQNSNKRPISGVRVEFDNIERAVSDEKGKVRLDFKPQKSGGFAVLSAAYKDGYELVNEKELQQVELGESEDLGVDIIVAKTGLVEAAKKEYFAIFYKISKLGFEREKARLQADLQAKRINSGQLVKGKVQLEKLYEQQQFKLSALAEKFARINLDDLSPACKEAIETLKLGNTEQAIAKLEGSNPVKKIEALILAEKGAVNTSTSPDQKKATPDQEKKQQLTDLRLLTDLYGLSFSFAKAEKAYDDLLRVGGSDLEVLTNVADFFLSNNLLDNSLKANALILAHPKVKAWQAAEAQRNIGMSYSLKKELPAALDAFIKAGKSYESLLQLHSESSFYQNNLAALHQNLGNIQMSMGNTSAASYLFEESNRLTKKLNQAYSQNLGFMQNLANSYACLANCHSRQGGEDALFYFQKYALFEKAIFSRSPNNSLFKQKAASSAIQLGLAYGYDDALDAFSTLQEAKTWLEELLEAYPEEINYKMDLGFCCEYLGLVYTQLEDLPKALTLYEKSNLVCKELSLTYPHLPIKLGLSLSHLHLAETHKALGNLKQALAFTEQHIEVNKALSKDSIQHKVANDLLISSYLSQGEIQQSLNNLPQALIAYENAKNLASTLRVKYPKDVSILMSLTRAYEKLGDIHKSVGKLPLALTTYEKFNTNAKELKKISPGDYQVVELLQNSYKKLAQTYTALGNKIQAAKYYEQAELLNEEISEAYREMLSNSPYPTPPPPGFGPDEMEEMQSIEPESPVMRSIEGETPVNGVDAINFLLSRTRNEKDTLTIFKYYNELCDTLRKRVSKEPSYKPSLAQALNSVAWYGFFVKKFAEVEKAILEGLTLDASNIYLPTNLAPALLLQGKREQALQEYKKWKDKAFGEQDFPTYREAFLDDLNAFEKAGIIPPARMEDVAAARKLLNEGKK
jgi:tetratricopeptide (TPR) repeat protein